jgi:hypothetical protein
MCTKSVIIEEQSRMPRSLLQNQRMCKKQNVVCVLPAAIHAIYQLKKYKPLDARDTNTTSTRDEKERDGHWICSTAAFHRFATVTP